MNYEDQQMESVLACHILKLTIVYYIALETTAQLFVA